MGCSETRPSPGEGISFSNSGWKPKGGSAADSLLEDLAGVDGADVVSASACASRKAGVLDRAEAGALPFIPVQVGLAGGARALAPIGRPIPLGGVDAEDLGTADDGRRLFAYAGEPNEHLASVVPTLVRPSPVLKPLMLTPPLFSSASDMFTSSPCDAGSS